MKDKLEQLFLDNREIFDDQEPQDELWPELEKKLAKKGSRVHSVWWRVAAVFIIGLVTVIYMLVRPQYESEIAINNNTPEIVLPTANGEMVALSSLKGKVVLVEFWASWCKTCQEENCYVFKPLYDQYKDKGFEIYAVSLDKDKNSWLKGIERDGLPWINVTDL